MEKKIKKKQTNWFVEPLDANTNEVICRTLIASHDLIEHISMLDENEESHSVIEVPNYAFINKLYKSKAKFKLDFNVYSKQGKYGKIKLWRFGEK